MRRVSYTCECGDSGGPLEPGKFNRKCLNCGEHLRKFRIVLGREPRETGRCLVDAMMVDRPRWSSAMGCHPNKIDEARKQFPGSEYNSDGDLLIRNRHHKLQEMKRRGLVECDGYRNRNGVRTRRRKRG